jgi:hypothetical protein
MRTGSRRSRHSFRTWPGRRPTGSLVRELEAGAAGLAWKMPESTGRWSRLMSARRRRDRTKRRCRTSMLVLAKQIPKAGCIPRGRLAASSSTTLVHALAARGIR